MKISLRFKFRIESAIDRAIKGAKCNVPLIEADICGAWSEEDGTAKSRCKYDVRGDDLFSDAENVQLGGSQKNDWRISALSILKANFRS